MQTDAQILKERGKQYGDPETVYAGFGKAVCNLVDIARANQGDVNYAHLGLMVMDALKLFRSVSNPNHRDNYQDGRNYLTLAEQSIKRKGRRNNAT